MEPLSISTGALSIATLATKLALQINTIIEEVRDAPKEFEDIKEEILSLQEIVAQLDPAVSAESQHVEAGGSAEGSGRSSENPELDRLLGQNVATLKELERTVESLRNGLRRGRFALVRHLFSWSSHRAKFQKLQMRLRDEKLLLVLMLQVSTL